ncbi:uncharacterized protein LOC121860995 isoform X2 [Homarus americanus]|uniref:uncharacterized protein LOC121860995 isoform X2 n=1 Tax=Homarus americanus TaxID=6706 RepID=UPI001C456AA6|nr:uncharacterized protein LOC121860995 isoform X2 [Homarus americanus]
MMEQQALGCVRPADSYQQEQQTTMLYATPASRPVATDRNFTRAKEKRKTSRGRTDDAQPLSKSMIGPPIDFQHVSHVNFDTASSSPPTNTPFSETMLDRREQVTVDPQRQKHSTNTTENHNNLKKTKKLSRRDSSTRLQDHPASQVRKVTIGPPTNFQHVTHVGFDDTATSNVIEERRETSLREARAPDITSRSFSCDSTDVGQREAQWGYQQWSRPDGDEYQQEAQWEDQPWSKPNCDGDKQKDQRESRRWSRPDEEEEQWEEQSWPNLPDDLSSSILPPPAGFRKEMIGPPTNFQHVLHVGPDVVDTELELLMKMANLNQQDKSDVKATDSVMAGVEERPGEDTTQPQHLTIQLDADDTPSTTHIPTPPPRFRRSLGGSPASSYQHVSHVRFSDATTTLHQVSQDQHHLQPTRETQTNSEEQLPFPVTENVIFDYPDLGQEEPRWDNQEWSRSSSDGGQREAHWKSQRWSRPDLQDDLPPPLTPPPVGLRKVMIGPPTNFQHVRHVDQSNARQEAQHLTKASRNDQSAPDLETSKSMPNLMERREGLRKARSQQDDRHGVIGISFTTRLSSPPPPRMRKDMIGPPTNFQHVTHVGFDDNTTSQVNQGSQHHRDSFTEKQTGWDEKQRTETKARIFHRDSVDSEGGQQQKQRWEKQRWSSPVTLEDSTTPPCSPPPVISKDMIGPPTNFKHVRHLDPDSVQQELQHLTKEGDVKVSRRPSTRRDQTEPSPPTRVRKHMIGAPTNFQHVAHVGINASWQANNNDGDQQQEGSTSLDTSAQHHTVDGET